MKKIWLTFIVCAVLAFVILGCESVDKVTAPDEDAVSGVATKPAMGEKGIKGQSGNSNVAHIELWEKDASWVIVEDGAWGKMKYNLSGPTFDFVFNGHKLVPETEYTLIYYPDPWPGTGLIELGEGTVDEKGNIHIAGSVDLGMDLNGAKIWLVLTDDIGGDSLSGWNPTEYLFEYDLITYDDTGEKGIKGQSGNSNVAHIELWEKDASWVIVEDGAWGKMKYNLSGSTFDFVFNGHALEPYTDYSLIYYADPWPGNNPGALIASGTTNDEGNIHLAGSKELNMDLPHPDDENTGAKIWLVLSNDYDGEKMVGWNPTEYLFDYELITYNDTDIL